MLLIISPNQVSALSGNHSLMRPIKKILFVTGKDSLPGGGVVVSRIRNIELVSMKTVEQRLPVMYYHLCKWLLPCD